MGPAKLAAKELVWCAVSSLLTPHKLSFSLFLAQLLALFPYSTPVIQSCNSLAGLLFLLAIVGIAGTRYRYKQVLVLWLFLNTILGVAAIIVATVLQNTLSDSEFDAYISTSFWANWKVSQGNKPGRGTGPCLIAN